MSNENSLLPDDAFQTFKAGPVEEGKYVLAVIETKAAPNTIRVRKSKTSGNRYAEILLSPKETLDGVRVNGSLVNHRLMLEGTDKNGKTLTGNFAGFFSALGFDKDQTRAIHAALIEDSSSASEEGIQVPLKLNGDQISIAGKKIAGSLKTEEYNGKVKNAVKSVWAAAV